FDKTRFIEGIRMDGHLDVITVGDAEAAINSGRGRAPVFMQLQSTCAGLDLLFQGPGQAAVALPKKAEVDRKGLRGLQHPFDIPGARRAGGGIGAGRGSAAAAQKGRKTGRNRRLAKLGTDEMNMAVDATSRDNQILPRDYLGS